MTSTLKLYAVIGLILAALAGVGIVYAKGRLDASHAAQLAALNQKITRMQQQADADAAALKLDAIQAKLDAEDLYAAAQRSQDLQDKLHAPDNVCFDDHDAGLVQDLWGPPAPAHPSRH